MNYEEILRQLSLDKDKFKDLHITRMFSSFVAVSEGKIVQMTDPYMDHCPLFNMLYKPPSATENMELLKECIMGAVEEKIKKFGSFTKLRGLERNDIAVPFGASEMIMFAINRKAIDAALIVCDGAGSVISDDPSLIQGIGARMNGLFYTTPIKDIILNIQKRKGYVVFPENAEINQIEALKKAASFGYKKIALTINGFTDEDLSKLEKIQEEFNISVVSIIVCTTGISEKRTEHLIRYSDLVWSCASGIVRDMVGKKSIMQISNAIPVFVLTQKGLDFVENYSTEAGVFKNLDLKKQYILSGHVKGKRLVMGNTEIFLAEEKLPVRCEKEPR